MTEWKPLFLPIPSYNNNNNNQQCDVQGPSLLCMNEVLGQLGEIGEIEQEGSNEKVKHPNIFLPGIYVLIAGLEG